MCVCMLLCCMHNANHINEELNGPFFSGSHMFHRVRFDCLLVLAAFIRVLCSLARIIYTRCTSLSLSKWERACHRGGVQYKIMCVKSFHRHRSCFCWPKNYPSQFIALWTHEKKKIGWKNLCYVKRVNELSNERAEKTTRHWCIEWTRGFSQKLICFSFIFYAHTVCVCVCQLRPRQQRSLSKIG